MKSTSVVGDPVIEGTAVVLRVAIEDPAHPESGGVFVCRMADYADIAVESFPPGQTPSSSGEDRVEAAACAMRYALENQGTFDTFFAELKAR